MSHNLAFCDSVKASTLIPEKKHTSNHLEGAANTWEGSSISRYSVLLCFLLYSNNTVIRCYEIGLWYLWYLSFRVALGDRLTSFNSHWCYSIAFLLWCTLELSTESCCLATECDLLTESAVSLSCLLQDYFDVCHGPIIQIIAIIRMLRDLVHPLSAFVHLSLNFTENKKLSIYWDTILHAQEKTKIYTSC